MAVMYTDEVAAAALRRNLAERLDDVLAGRTFVVTRSGRPTAVLAPLDDEEGE